MKTAIKLDYSKLCDIEVGGIDTHDYPDFVDAYIESASIEISREEYNLCQGENQVEYNGKYFRDLTEEELDVLNDNSDYVYEKVMQHIY